VIGQPGLYDFFRTGFDRKGKLLSQKKVIFRVDFFLVLLRLAVLPGFGRCQGE